MSKVVAFGLLMAADWRRIARDTDSEIIRRSAIDDAYRWLAIVRTSRRKGWK